MFFSVKFLKLALKLLHYCITLITVKIGHSLGRPQYIPKKPQISMTCKFFGNNEKLKKKLLFV